MTAAHPYAQKANGAEPSKAIRAVEVKPCEIGASLVDSTTTTLLPVTPEAGTFASFVLLALIDAGPAGLCPQQFYDNTGRELKHGVHLLRRMRWPIVTRRARSRNGSETTYVLGV